MWFSIRNSETAHAEVAIFHQMNKMGVATRLRKVYLPAGCCVMSAKASKLRPSEEDHLSNICEFYIFLGSVVFLDYGSLPT